MGVGEKQYMIIISDRMKKSDIYLKSVTDVSHLLHEKTYKIHFISQIQEELFFFRDPQPLHGALLFDV